MIHRRKAKRYINTTTTTTNNNNNHDNNNDNYHYDNDNNDNNQHTDNTNMQLREGEEVHQPLPQPRRGLEGVSGRPEHV